MLSFFFSRKAPTADQERESDLSQNDLHDRDVDSLLVFCRNFEKMMDTDLDTALTYFRRLVQSTIYNESKYSSYHVIVEQVDAALRGQCTVFSDCLGANEANAELKEEEKDGLPQAYLNKNGIQNMEALEEEIVQLREERAIISSDLEDLQKPASLTWFVSPFFLGNKTAEMIEKTEKMGLLQHRLEQLCQYKETYLSISQRNNARSSSFEEQVNLKRISKKILFLFGMLDTLKVHNILLDEVLDVYQRGCAWVDFLLKHIKEFLDENYSIVEHIERWHALGNETLISAVNRLKYLVIGLLDLGLLPGATKTFDEYFLDTFYFELSTHAGNLFQFAGACFMGRDDMLFFKVLEVAKRLSDLDKVIPHCKYGEIITYYQKKHQNRLFRFEDHLREYIKNHCLAEIVMEMTYLSAASKSNNAYFSLSFYQNMLERSRRLLSDFVLDVLEDARLQVILSDSSDRSVLLLAFKNLRKIEQYENELRPCLTEAAYDRLRTDYKQIKDILNEQLNSSIQTIFLLLHAMQFFELERERKKVKLLYSLLGKQVSDENRVAVMAIPDEIKKQLEIIINRYRDADDFFVYCSLNPPKDLVSLLNGIKSFDHLYSSSLEKLYAILENRTQSKLSLLLHDGILCASSRQIRQMKNLLATLPTHIAELLGSDFMDVFESSQTGTAKFSFSTNQGF